MSVKAGGVIVYVAEETALFPKPLAVAMALIVSLENTPIGASYGLELVLGVVPSRV